MEDFTPAAERAAVKRWLRQLRKASGMSQPELALLLGVSRETISNAERERGSLPQGLTMVHYLRALGAVTEAPVVLPGAGPLEALEGLVAKHGEQTTRALEALAAEVRALTQARDGEDPPASQAQADV